MKNTVPHRTIRGELLYTSRKPGREGHERGREFYTIVVHADGRRTLNSHCEIDDPPPVIRDVTLSFDVAQRPTDALVRLSVGDRFVGTSRFRFGARELECEAYTALEGRVSQRTGIEAPIGAFGTHPIQADAMLMKHPNGLRLAFVGEERITVKAGTFDTWHFRIGDNVAQEAVEEGSANEPGKHPPYDMWTTSDGDFVCVKAQVTGYMQTHYELVTLAR